MEEKYYFHIPDEEIEDQRIYHTQWNLTNKKGMRVCSKHRVSQSPWIKAGDDGIGLMG